MIQKSAKRSHAEVELPDQKIVWVQTMKNI